MRPFKDYANAAQDAGYSDAEENYALNNVYFDFDIRQGYSASSRVRNILDNKIVGVTDWKARFPRADVAYLADIDTFDKQALSGANVKSGEYVFRYATEDTAIGGIAPYIKINIQRGLIYFLTEESSSGETDDVRFETRGVKAKFLRLSPEWKKKLNIL